MESTQKKLYEHFIATNQHASAAEVLTRYPQFAKKAEPVAEEPVEEVEEPKKRGKK